MIKEQIAKQVHREAGEGAAAEEVRAHFSHAAAHYDSMNDLMSGGLHHVWKRAMLNWLAAPAHASYRLLDLASGSGDLALGFLASGKQGRVVLADPNLAMLGEAGKRLGQDHTKNGFLLGADGECLPFATDSFNACLIGFGIRNIARRDVALAEIYRILKPGGRFLCLEFTPEARGGLQSLYDIYLTQLIPAMGERFANEREAYLYLARSIKKFPRPEKFASALEGVGFRRAQFRLFAGGVVALFSGWKF